MVSMMHTMEVTEQERRMEHYTLRLNYRIQDEYGDDESNRYTHIV